MILLNSHVNSYYFRWNLLLNKTFGHVETPRALRNPGEKSTFDCPTEENDSYCLTAIQDVTRHDKRNLILENHKKGL